MSYYYYYYQYRSVEDELVVRKFVFWTTGFDRNRIILITFVNPFLNIGFVKAYNIGFKLELIIANRIV